MTHTPYNDPLTQTQIEAAQSSVEFALRRLVATQTLQVLLQEYALDGRVPFLAKSYTADEKSALVAIHRAHLLRRIYEEATKAGIKL